VQEKRKKDDGEIFSLFKDPFRNIMGYKECLCEEASLFGKFNLDEVSSAVKTTANQWKREFIRRGKPSPN